MPVPLVHKPEHRLGDLKEGDRVAYFHWEIGPDGLRTGKAIQPRSLDGTLQYVGIVERITKDSTHSRILPKEHHAVEGELVIRILHKDGRPKHDHYERLTHLPPMHQMDQHARHMKEPEPRRWFKVGIDPNTPEHIQTIEVQAE